MREEHNRQPWDTAADYVGSDRIEQPPAVRKKDPFVEYWKHQSMACLAALLAVAVFALLIGGDINRNVRDKYIELFCDPTSVSEVLDSLSLQNKQAQSVGTVTDTAVQAMASVTVTPTAVAGAVGDDLGDSRDDSKALKENRLLLTAASASAGNGMALPVVGRVTSHFGYRIHPIYGTRLFHNGVDIGADEGSSVMASLSGIVQTAEYNDSYGYHIILDHGNGLQTVYAHCSRLLVTPGQQVEKGESIACVGSTGVSTGPHLHFEVRRGEYKINPAWLVDFS